MEKEKIVVTLLLATIILSISSVVVTMNLSVDKLQTVNNQEGTSFANPVSSVSLEVAENPNFSEENNEGN